MKMIHSSRCAPIFITRWSRYARLRLHPNEGRWIKRYDKFGRLRRRGRTCQRCRRAHVNREPHLQRRRQLLLADRVVNNCVTRLNYPIRAR
jgi:hypothetical protein